MLNLGQTPRVRPPKVKGQGQVQVRAFRRGSCCRKCKVLNVPTATGQHCPEGWTIYHKPGTAFQGIAVNSDLNYLIFVDRNGVLGLGKDVPMTGAVNSDAILAADSENRPIRDGPYSLPHGVLHAVDAGAN